MLMAVEEPDCETLRVPVVKVFDGDGFLTHIRPPGFREEMKVAVRFGFIDAPEMDQPGGPEARDFLCGLIADQWLDLAVLLKMDTGRSFDAYRRLVAVPYLRHAKGKADQPPSLLRRLIGSGLICRNIELEMILNGWAWLLERYGPDERYYEALEDAQRNRRGIWAMDNPACPWEHKIARYRARGKRVRPVPVVRRGPWGSGKEPCPAAGCGGHVVVRQGRYGRFRGCSAYPKCRHSRPLDGDERGWNSGRRPERR